MKTINHILVIRLSALGDVAMLVPILRVVTATYPNLKITVLTKTFFKPLFSNIDNISLLEADVKGKHKGFGIFTLANEAHHLNIEAVADTHNVLRSQIIRFILWFRGVKTAAIDKGRAEKKALTNVNGKKIKPLKSTHQRYADVFESLGFPIDLSTHKFPGRYPLTPQLQELIGSAPKKLIGIAPFAAHKGKMYPIKKMQKVIERLQQTNRYKIFLFGGGKKETETLEKMSAGYNDVYNISEKFTFEEEVNLISNLDVMLSMDSGNGHLAAIFGIPVITLWGVTHPYAGFVPFMQPNNNQVISNRDKFPLIPTSIYGNKYPKGYENVMETIPEELVGEKILGVL